MSGFFFGPKEKKLFGFYHSPQGDAQAVLISPPWGVEYQYAHRALRSLAQRLAEQGCHVFRFDFSGTGDSWGKCQDAGLNQWMDDLDEAARELRSLSGKESFDLVGLRLGATMAMKFAGSAGGVGNLVLWDPILDGQAWLQELQQVAQEHEGSVRKEPSDRSLEVGRHPVSPQFLTQIQDIRIEDLDTVEPAKILVLTTEEGDSLERWTKNMKGPLEREYRQILQPPAWKEDTSIWGGHLPVGALTAIVDWLGSQ